MKNYLKTFGAIALTIGLSVSSFAQEGVNAKTPLVLGKIEPYKMEVTYDKTSHLIFPIAIRYVDLGSEYLIAGKAEDAENVLRVKAGVRNFKPETNFSVITDDGRFYGFDVQYSSCPEVLNHDLLPFRKVDKKGMGSNVFFKELGNSSPSEVEMIMKSIIKNGDQPIKHFRSKNSGIQFLLKGIYIYEGKYYFHTEINNLAHIPFEVDLISFRVMDKKGHKRTAVQERSLEPIRSFRPLGVIGGKSTEDNVFLLDRFTMAWDKVLRIELFEKNGGRNQTLRIPGSALINARLIKDVGLKF